MGLNACDVFFPSPYRICRVVNDTSRLEIFRDSGFDPVACLDSHWAMIEPAQHSNPKWFSSGQDFDVPARRLMSATADAACNAIVRGEVGLMRAGGWQRHGLLGFGSPFPLVCDTYGNIVNNVFPVVALSLVSRLTEDNDD